MSIKSVSERVKKHLKKMKDAGLESIRLWVHPDDKADVRKYAKDKLDKRLEK